MPSLDELKVTINEQKEQLASYERKLKGSEFYNGNIMSTDFRCRKCIQKRRR